MKLSKPLGAVLLGAPDAASLENIRALHENGFGAIQVPVVGMQDNDLGEIRRYCDDHTIIRSALVAFLLDEIPRNARACPVSPNPAYRKNAREQIRIAFEKAAILGVTDGVYGPCFRGLLGKPSIPTEDERKLQLDFIRTVDKLATDARMPFRWEVLNRFEFSGPNTLRDAANLLDEALGGGPMRDFSTLLADTCHQFFEEKSTVEAWETEQSAIGGVHVSESTRGLLGSGQALTDDVLQMLNALNVNTVYIEAFGSDCGDLIARALRFWRRPTQTGLEAMFHAKMYLESRLGRLQ